MLHKSRGRQIMNNTHGGFRAGAGRKKSEETKVIRVPESKILDIKEYLQSALLHKDFITI